MHVTDMHIVLFPKVTCPHGHDGMELVRFFRGATAEAVATVASAPAQVPNQAPPCCSYVQGSLPSHWLACQKGSKVWI